MKPANDSWPEGMIWSGGKMNEVPRSSQMYENNTLPTA